MPAWKKAGNLVEVKNSWLAQNLDPHHVILDVRDEKESDGAHIKSAVRMGADRIQKLNPSLPSLSDKNAPIILYAEGDSSPSVRAAFKGLLSLKYKSVAVLDGGFRAWQDKGLPTETGKAATQIVYVKKPVKGSVSPEEFTKLQHSGEATILDVRTKTETVDGVIKNAVPIPLEELDARMGELPLKGIIVVHCATGARAEIAYRLLEKHGLKAAFLNDTIHVGKDGTFSID